MYLFIGTSGTTDLRLYLGIEFNFLFITYYNFVNFVDIIIV